MHCTTCSSPPTVRQERHAFYVGEAERWEHLAAHSARSTNSKDMQA
ncbi:hypothetical protein [Stenotrophomonas hibiscicola]